MLKIKDNVDLKELEKYGFEVGYEFEYEKMHVDCYYNGSKSVVVDETTKEIFIVCYNFSYDETNGTKKIIKKEQYIKKYIKDLIKADLVEKID